MTLKIHNFRIAFIMPECAKTHLQQSAISKILRGRNPRTPASKGRPRITRQGRERLTRGGQGKGSGGVILTDWAKLDITVCTYTMHTFYKKYHATSSKSATSTSSLKAGVHHVSFQHAIYVVVCINQWSK